jgi:hypothetical protein
MKKKEEPAEPRHECREHGAEQERLSYTQLANYERGPTSGMKKKKKKKRRASEKT